MADDHRVADQIIVLVGTLSGAVLAFFLQSLSANRERRHEVADRQRAERIQAASALPTALVEYRHAQLARRRNQLTSASDADSFDGEVREARGAAWSALYRFELLVDDEPVRDAAYDLMGKIKQLKTIEDRENLETAGTEVHWAIQRFIELARTRLSFA